MVNIDNLIWLDLEMTGLNPEVDKILELGVVITDKDFNILTAETNLVIWQADSILNAMDNWNTTHHTASGLVAEVKNSKITEQQAEAQILALLQQYTVANTSPMCGNSVYQDRRFLSKYMPKLEGYFHYRNLDVSTLKILAQKFAADLVKDRQKESKHRAIDDILESIEEMKFYLAKFIKLS